MKIPILGVQINSESKEETKKILKKFLFSKTQHHVATINPEFVMQAQKDLFFKYILNHCDIATCDGIGIIFASYFLGMPIRQRFTGVDLTFQIAKICQKTNKSIFLLGGKKNSAEETAKKLKRNNPGLKIFGTSDVFLSNIKFIPQNVIEMINANKPDVLLVALGAPKQEKFIHYNLKKFPSVKIAAGVGGTFDYISGKIKRAPKFFRKLGLEFIYRLYKQPSRFKRIYTALVKFTFETIKWRFRIWCCYRKNVIAVIFNKDKKLLLVQRENETQTHWQFPQGGVESKESEQQAILREMHEELGTNKLKIIKKLDLNLSYIWPKWHQLIKGYKGQKQHVFLLQFLGTDSDFKFYIHKEISKHLWVKKGRVLELIHPVRKDSAQKILDII